MSMRIKAKRIIPSFKIMKQFRPLKFLFCNTTNFVLIHSTYEILVGYTDTNIKWKAFCSCLTYGLQLIKLSVPLFLYCGIS